VPVFDHSLGKEMFPQVKTVGPDGIHPRVLKELADVTAGRLFIIYKRSWESGDVPTDRKVASQDTAAEVSHGALTLNCHKSEE